MVPNGVELLTSAQSGNGPDPTAVKNGASLLRGAHGLEGKFIALYAGAHGMANDLSQILDAAASLANDPRIAIVLVGDGPEKAELQQRAQAEQLHNLIFLPPLDQANIDALLKEADCGVAVLKPIPMFTTTYPNKVFDYMAAELPVVLAIDGAIRQVIEDGRAGIYVEPGSGHDIGAAIQRLADDPQKASQMGQNGRGYVEKYFDRSTHASKMEEVLLTLG